MKRKILFTLVVVMVFGLTLATFAVAGATGITTPASEGYIDASCDHVHFWGNVASGEIVRLEIRLHDGPGWATPIIQNDLILVTDSGPYDQYVNWVDNPDSRPHRVAVSASTDGGNSWSTLTVEEDIFTCPPPPPDNPGTGTPGYWMNHPEAWPVDSITISGVTYTKDEAIANMQTSPKGDKTYTMYFHLVASMLNVAIGNDSSCIASTIAAADQWLTDNPLGSGVKGKDWRSGDPIKTTLDNYNNGLLCAPHRD